ncbi:uncharacterized protein LOC111121471 isoform X2 [Crassostrea virginica]|uniref:Uncharacterized protein LOC111121471 isoform X2 n=1 Tax=Crassostrea virginica TaxID=6565 RepID=A0A8B8CRN1_CRAVI|nr:uncharacterized protein LOC111121471 isoform X2 [Crassostrea virginica]
MERSTVPLRHSGSQGSVRLPRRFAVPGSGDDSPDRLADLTRALCWIRQELKNRVPRHEIMSSTSSLQSTSSSVDITMENYGVRTATSATLLQECEDCVEDTISFSRPRTSSMKTIRDLAALARRRGSKEMI